MRILVAPDKFKGSLGALEVAENIAAGLRDVLSDVEIVLLPMADGGEGTAAVIARACGAEWVTCPAHDALGGKIEVRYCWTRSGGPAVMEMSEAAGSWRLSPGQLDPNRASTFGVGEMLLDASRRDAAEVIVGLGGSATNDGGFGMARALGFRFVDTAGVALNENVLDLARLKHIEPPAKLHLGRITAAADVRAPLLGPSGATFTFAPQKGARADELPMLEAALAQFADVVAQDFGCDYRMREGAGAAGGLGFGLMSFAGAKIKSGFGVVADAIDLQGAVAHADVVITGEGRLDSQTLEGKAPAGIAQIARSAGKRVFAIVGSAVEDQPATALFDGVWPLAVPPVTCAESMERAGELLRARARELALTFTSERRHK